MAKYITLDNLKTFLACLQSENYKATDSKYGAIKVNDGANNTGTKRPVKLDNNGCSYIDMGQASESDFGVVKVTAGTGLIIEDGAIRIGAASSSSFGAVKVTSGNGLTIKEGVLSMGSASYTSSGAVQISEGHGLRVVDGVLSMGSATSTQIGGIAISHASESTDIPVSDNYNDIRGKVYGVKLDINDKAYVDVPIASNILRNSDFTKINGTNGTIDSAEYWVYDGSLGLQSGSSGTISSILSFDPIANGPAIKFKYFSFFQAVPTLTAGKTYTLSFNYYNPIGNTTVEDLYVLPPAVMNTTLINATVTKISNGDQIPAPTSIGSQGYNFESTGEFNEPYKATITFKFNSNTDTVSNKYPGSSIIAFQATSNSGRPWVMYDIKLEEGDKATQYDRYEDTCVELVDNYTKEAVSTANSELGPGKNIIKNGSFTIDGNPSFKSWHFLNLIDSSEPLRDPLISNGVVELKGNTSISQYIDIKSDKTYTLSFDFNFQNSTSNSLVIYLPWHDDCKIIKKSSYITQKDDPAASGQVDADVFYHNLLNYSNYPLTLWNPSGNNYQGRAYITFKCSKDSSEKSETISEAIHFISGSHSFNSGVKISSVQLESGSNATEYSDKPYNYFNTLKDEIDNISPSSLNAISWSQIGTTMLNHIDTGGTATFLESKGAKVEKQYSKSWPDVDNRHTSLDGNNIDSFKSGVLTNVLLKIDGSDCNKWTVFSDCSINSGNNDVHHTIQTAIEDKKFGGAVYTRLVEFTGNPYPNGSDIYDADISSSKYKIVMSTPWQKSVSNKYINFLQDQVKSNGLTLEFLDENHDLHYTLYGLFGFKKMYLPFADNDIDRNAMISSYAKYLWSYGTNIGGDDNDTTALGVCYAARGCIEPAVSQILGNKYSAILQEKLMFDYDPHNWHEWPVFIGHENWITELRYTNMVYPYGGISYPFNSLFRRVIEQPEIDQFFQTLSGSDYSKITIDTAWYTDVRAVNGTPHLSSQHGIVWVNDPITNQPVPSNYSYNDVYFMKNTDYKENFSSSSTGDLESRLGQLAAYGWGWGIKIGTHMIMNRNNLPSDLLNLLEAGLKNPNFSPYPAKNKYLSDNGSTGICLLSKNDNSFNIQNPTITGNFRPRWHDYDVVYIGSAGEESTSHELYFQYAPCPHLHINESWDGYNGSETKLYNSYKLYPYLIGESGYINHDGFVVNTEDYIDPKNSFTCPSDSVSHYVFDLSLGTVQSIKKDKNLWQTQQEFERRIKKLEQHAGIS